jgi:hypothetical protein
LSKSVRLAVFRRESMKACGEKEGVSRLAGRLVAVGVSRFVTVVVVEFEIVDVMEAVRWMGVEGAWGLRL